MGRRWWRRRGAGEDAAAMGTEGGTGSVDGAGGAGAVRTRLGALGCPFLGLPRAPRPSRA